MSFFKVDTEFKDPDPNIKESDPYKLRYVINSNGKGKWIPPLFSLSTDYDEDIDM